MTRYRYYSVLHKLAALEGTSAGSVADKTLRLVVALGHSDCGAVTAAVDTFLGNNDLSSNASEFLVEDAVRGLLGRIHLPAVNLAAKALPAGSFGASAKDVDLYRKSLIELSVYVNAAWSGHDMKTIVDEYCFEAGKEVEVRYGVFDPRDCFVRAVDGYHFAPGGDTLMRPQSAGEALNSPPDDLDELYDLSQKLAAELKRQHKSGKDSLEKFFRMQ